MPLALYVERTYIISSVIRTVVHIVPGHQKLLCSLTLNIHSCIHALSRYHIHRPTHRRQSWGLGRRDPPDVGQGVSGGSQRWSQGGSWTGRKILLYLIMYRKVADF